MCHRYEIVLRCRLLICNIRSAAQSALLQFCGIISRGGDFVNWVIVVVI